MASKIITIQGGDSVTGNQYSAIASCTNSGNGNFQAAYGGGGYIVKNSQSSDVVVLDQSLPGTFDQSSFVPGGPNPGLAGMVNGGHTQGQNAWEADAVIFTLPQGHTATVQAYVVCGPAGAPGT